MYRKKVILLIIIALMLTGCVKIDNNIDMGLLSDVKMQLRKAYALQIVYSANEAKSSTGN